MIDCPFYILHYKGNSDRLAYLRQAFAETGVHPILMIDMDPGEFSLDQVYRFDEATFVQQIMSIKDVMIASVVGEQRKDWPWKACVEYIGRQRLTPEQVLTKCEWLRPRWLKPGDVSLLLKHKLAWKNIAAGSSDYAVVAEDDVILFDNSLSNLSQILACLPQDFDYIDLAGGCNLKPRPGAPLVNSCFYAIDPPRDRTTCCAIISKRFAEKILEIGPPLALPIDWMMTYLFNLTKAKVYWVEPIVFAHGTQINVYKSNLR